MEISRNNYEEYFLDFAEGNLTAEQEKILNNFLKLNPDLNEELREFDLLQIRGDKVQMPGRNAMKKEIPGSGNFVTSGNFEMFSIAYIEKDLSELQRTSFETLVQTDKKYRERFEVMKKTFLSPETVSFPNKTKLKRSSGVNINLRILVPFAAAAAIALLIFIRTDIFVSKPDIASLTQSELRTEAIELKPVEKKPPVKEKAATIQIIKSSRAPVPVSNIKKEMQNANQQSENAKETKQKESDKIAGLTLPKVQIPILTAEKDHIKTQVQPIPRINPSSLSISDRLRYQIDRASGLMNEDDVFIWNLASQGIKEINKLAGTDMSLMASQDEDGDISGFQFRSRILNVTAPLAQNKE